ncbi:MAG: YjbE family putative metal transport protein [Roseiarcus sp.]|jgi:YjbE family integral membrane protein
MDLSAGASWLVIPLQIFVVDLLLGADNALLIAVACNGLSREDARRAATIGSGGAIVLRLLLATIATSLLGVPLVKLIGAWALIVIALNVSADSQREALPTPEPGAARRDLWAAATAIVVADAAMSLDNVIALAAIARGNFWLLAAGVVFSIPVLAYGGVILSAALRAAPWLVKLSAALLGWIAGDMAVTDPLIGDWIAVNAPALAAIAPAFGAVFVFFADPSPRPAKPAPSVAVRPALAPLPPKPAAPPAPPPPRPRPKLVAAEAASAKLVAAEPTPTQPEPGEPEARVERSRLAMSSDDRFAVIGVLVFALIAGIVLMLVSYLDSAN